MRINIEITTAQAKYLQFLEKHNIKEESREYITQNQAYKRFGRSNVERWVKLLIIRQFVRPKLIEYKLTELTRAAENQQDYLNG